MNMKKIQKMRFADLARRAMTERKDRYRTIKLVSVVAKAYESNPEGLRKYYFGKNKYISRIANRAYRTIVGNLDGFEK
jgi:hypothetical protein